MEYLEFNANNGIAATKIEPLGQLYMKVYFEQIRIVVYILLMHIAPDSSARRTRGYSYIR
jgi:hypothetical protein